MFESIDYAKNLLKRIFPLNRPPLFGDRQDEF